MMKFSPKKGARFTGELSAQFEKSAKLEREIKRSLKST